jgi:hypothetical protein
MTVSQASSPCLRPKPTTLDRGLFVYTFLHMSALRACLQRPWRNSLNLRAAYREPCTAQIEILSQIMAADEHRGAFERLEVCCGGFVKRVVGLVAVVVTAFVGCAEPETVTAGAWPTSVDEPDVIDIEVAPEVVVTPPDLVDEVIVEPDALVFGIEQAQAVAEAFPVGAPVVGDRAQGRLDASSGNPLGFLRKVTAVRTDGDFVVVDTEPATLPDIMTGTVSQTFDPAESLPVEFGDLPVESFFPLPSIEEGGDNTGEPGGFIRYQRRGDHRQDVRPQ